MTNMIILMVMLCSLMAAITYGLVGAMRSLQTNIEKLAIEDRLEETANAVIANIISVATSSSQIYYVPAPDTLSATSSTIANPSVPSWVTSNAVSPRGVKFLYCPFSNASGAGSTTVTTPNSSYTINTGTAYAGTNISSNMYVTQSSTRPTNASTALAVIVAPAPNQTSFGTTQDCLNVTSTGTLSGGGAVRVITEQEVQSRAQVTAGMGNEFYVASTATNNAKGTSTGNYALLSTVMDYVNKFRPQRVTVNLKSGDSITVANSNMDQTSISTAEFSSVRNHSILFSGLGANPLTTANQNLSAFSPSAAMYPVVLGSVSFQGVAFTPVAGKLYRPTAEMFGNVIAGNTTGLPFIKVVGGSSGIYAGRYSTTYSGSSGYKGFSQDSGTSVGPRIAMAGAPSASPTGKEMNYAARGGRFVFAGTTTSPATLANFNNSILYTDYGGWVGGNNTPLFTFTSNNNSSNPFFVVNAGGIAYIDLGTSGSSGATTPSYVWWVDVGGRFNLTNQWWSNFRIPLIYIRGGVLAQDYVNYALSSSASIPYYYYAGPGSIFYHDGATGQSIGTSITRPTIAGIFMNNGTTQDRMALYSAYEFMTPPSTSTYVYGSSASSNCYGDNTSYNLGSDNYGTSNGTTNYYVGAQGNIGMEATLMLNGQPPATACQ